MEFFRSFANSTIKDFIRTLLPEMEVSIFLLKFISTTH